MSAHNIPRAIQAYIAFPVFSVFNKPFPSQKKSTAISRRRALITMSKDTRKPVLFLTNDDGISPDTALILPLAQRLTSDGHDVVICAPGHNNSACSMRLTLSKSNVMRRHRDFEEQFGSSESSGTLSVFSIDDGTPCDCVIAGIEPGTGLLARMGKRPHLVVSGINVGQNLGTDIYYSGTFSAARQSSIYGIPSIALSLDLYTRQPNAPKYASSLRNALDASSTFVRRALEALPQPLPNPGRFNFPAIKDDGELKYKDSDARDVSKTGQARLEDAFSQGDVTFNVNIPKDWDGSFSGSILDSVLYRSILDIEPVPSGVPGSKDEVCEFFFSGKRSDRLCAPGSDAYVLQHSQSASVSPLSTWPILHSLALPDTFFSDVLKQPSTFWEKSFFNIKNVPQTQK